MIDATSVDLSTGLAKTLGGRTLGDMKALAPGTYYSESTSAQVSPENLTAVKHLGAELGSPAVSTGPVEPELNNSGKAVGLVAGACGQMPGAFHGITDLVASELAEENLQLFDIEPGRCKTTFPQQVRRSLELALHRG